MKKRYPYFPKKWLRCGLLTAFAASFSLSLQAQTDPAKLWDKTFGGSGTDELHCIQQTSDGGYIIGGDSYSNISGDKTQASRGLNDYWVVKLDAGGNKLWDKTFGGSDNDVLTSLQQTSDGGYILGGHSESGISGDKTQASKGGLYSTDYWVIKLDASGNKLWDKTFGGSEKEYLSTLQQTPDGGYILGGSSDSGISGDKTQASKGISDYWILKLDASGNKIWDKTIGGSYFDGLSSLKQTSDGGYILGGTSWSGISGDKSQACQGNADYWIVKLDATGNKLWDKTFGGNDYDGFSFLQQTSDGGYALGGTSWSGISGDKSQACQGNADYWVVKLDTNGNKIWDKTLGGSNEERFFSIQQITDGSYICGGWSESGISGDKTQNSKGYQDFWVVKLDANGNKTWDKTLGGSGGDRLSSLLQTSDGDCILGGSSGTGIDGDKSQVCQGVSDYWVVKLSLSVTGISENKATFPVSIFPNPNNGRFNLQLSNLTVPDVEVTVSDMLGRVVLQQELQVSDEHIFQELALPAANGIYLMQLKAGKQIFTRKIVIE